MSKLVFDTPQGVRISIDSYRPLLLSPALQNQISAQQFHSPLATRSLVDVPDIESITTQLPSKTQVAGAGILEIDDQDDPTLSAFGHKKKRSKFKQTYCAPGIKSILKLDNVPPPLSVQAEIAQNYLPLGVAPVAAAIPAAVPAAIPTAVATPAFASSVVAAPTFGSSIVAAPTFGAGFGSGIVAAPTFGAGLGGGCGGLALADALLGFGFPRFAF